MYGTIKCTAKLNDLKMWKKSEICLEKYKVDMLAQEKLENQTMPEIIPEIEMYP